MTTPVPSELLGIPAIKRLLKERLKNEQKKRKGDSRKRKGNQSGTNDQPGENQ